MKPETHNHKVDQNIYFRKQEATYISRQPIKIFAVMTDLTNLTSRSRNRL